MSWLLWQGAMDSAARTPDAPAVRDHAQSLSYGRLAILAGRVAGRLRSLGFRRGDRLGMFAPKAARNVAVMLGTSRAGGAYVPVDPAAPAHRAGFILGNARVRALATTSRLLSSLQPIPSVGAILLLDDAERAELRPGWDAVPVLSWRELTDGGPDDWSAEAVESDCAYILYTSGSTGTPKGVVISHRNAQTFVDWGVETFRVTAEDRLSNHAPFHFDLSVFDLYGALATGASVSLVPERVAPFPGELARWIHDERITVWYSVPSALIRLLLHGQLERFGYEHVRTVLFAGEVFPVKHLREVMARFPAAGFHNLYGPTETNVCTWYTVPRPLPPGDADLPIGVPCANIDAFALTEAGRPAGPGEEGELLVRGPCVMLGYWGLPERTAQSLGQNPLHADFSDPVYRTGDIVRVLPGGGFGFLGRRDHMVKTRGYRVELGEIEQAMHECPGVRSAAAVAIPDDEIGARIVGAFVPQASNGVTAASVLSFCRTRLPVYAVPERLERLDEMPTTSTGKVDRQTLGALLARPAALENP